MGTPSRIARGGVFCGYINDFVGNAALGVLRCWIEPFCVYQPIYSAEYFIPAGIFHCELRAGVETNVISIREICHPKPTSQCRPEACPAEGSAKDLRKAHTVKILRSAQNDNISKNILMEMTLHGNLPLRYAQYNPNKKTRGQLSFDRAFSIFKITLLLAQLIQTHPVKAEQRLA